MTGLRSSCRLGDDGLGAAWQAMHWREWAGQAPPSAFGISPRFAGGERTDQGLGPLAELSAGVDDGDGGDSFFGGHHFDPLGGAADLADLLDLRAQDLASG